MQLDLVRCTPSPPRALLLSSRCGRQRARPRSSAGNSISGAGTDRSMAPAIRASLLLRATSSVGDQSLSHALTGIVGARRPWTASMVSALSMLTGIDLLAPELAKRQMVGSRPLLIAGRSLTD